MREGNLWKKAWHTPSPQVLSVPVVQLSSAVSLLFGDCDPTPAPLSPEGAIVRVELDLLNLAQETEENPSRGITCPSGRDGLRAIIGSSISQKAQSVSFF